MFRIILVRASALALVSAASMTAFATGPIEQNSSINGIPRLLSHVQIRNEDPSFLYQGSGTIIDKHTDANNNGWVCVLTADHVVRNKTNHFIDLGSGAVTTYGGADSWYLSASPIGTRGRDVAVLAVRIGDLGNANTAAAFNAIAPVSLANFGADYSGNLRNINHTIFTEHGYGRTASYVDGGMGAGANSTNIRRFQDNQIERWRRVNNADYDYWAAEFDFNIPTANGPLLTEGLSFAGDSGGAYCTSQLETKTVLNSFRNNIHENRDGTGNVIPNVPANSQLGLWVDSLIAVHTSGSSNGRTINPFTTYDINGNPIAQNVGGVNDYSWGAGVAMTTDVITWVNDACNVVPAPSIGSIGLMGTLVALRRRR